MTDTRDPASSQVFVSTQPFGPSILTGSKSGPIWHSNLRVVAQRSGDRSTGFVVAIQ